MPAARMMRYKEQGRASSWSCMGQATIHWMNTATLHTNGQLVAVPLAHHLSSQVYPQLVLQQSSTHSALSSQFKNGWGTNLIQLTGDGEHKMEFLFQWKQNLQLHQTTCSIWYHVDANKMAATTWHAAARNLDFFVPRCAANAVVSLAAIQHLY